MEKMRCEKCRKVLNPATAVSLEMSFRTGKLYKSGECPPDESQGCFPYGPDCAAQLLKDGSVPVYSPEREAELAKKGAA